MPYFRLATEILESDLLFPELLVAEGPASLFFAEDRSRQQRSRPQSWIRSVEVDDGSIWLASGKVEDNYWFHFPLYSDFEFRPAAGQVTAYPHPETDTATVRHLLLDHVFPLVLNHRGLTVLHASAVASQDGSGAMVFLGKSGAGKSTFAASLCAQGLSLLADDCLIVDVADNRLLAIPLYPGLRLWSTSTEQFQWDSANFATVAQYTEKRRVPLADAGLRFESLAVPITAIFLFNPQQEEAREIRLSQLTTAESMIRLLECSFCLEPDNKQRNELDFRRLTTLANNIPVNQVQFPYDFALLPKLQEAVLSAPISR